MYQVGDVVVHPMHGSGTISAVISERISGREQVYYVFSLPTGGLELHIPVEKAQTLGMRELICLERAESLIQSFATLHGEHCSNWSKRYRDNLERLKSGDIEQVVQVLKVLLLRDCQQGLSTGERKMLYTAKQIFITEMSMVTGQEYQSVEKTIYNAVLTASQHAH